MADRELAEEEQLRGRLVPAVALNQGAVGDGPPLEHQLTPRCLDAWDCATRPSLKNGTRATIKIGSGFEVTPVEDGCWWAPQRNTSAAGFWVVAPC